MSSLIAIKTKPPLIDANSFSVNQIRHIVDPMLRD
jgi:hypothetical protein